jgi:hypothetical protein
MSIHIVSISKVDTDDAVGQINDLAFRKTGLIKWQSTPGSTKQQAVNFTYVSNSSFEIGSNSTQLIFMDSAALVTFVVRNIKGRIDLYVNKTIYTVHIVPGIFDIPLQQFDLITIYLVAPTHKTIYGNIGFEYPYQPG